jgi:hypothetical protein
MACLTLKVKALGLIRNVGNIESPHEFPVVSVNPLNAELNTIFHLLALLLANHIFHVSRIRVNAG